MSIRGYAPWVILVAILMAVSRAWVGFSTPSNSHKSSKWEVEIKSG